MAQSRAAKTARTKAQDRTGKRSLVSRAGAAARKVVGRGSKAEETEPKKPVTKKTAAKKTSTRKSA